ncbi:hypothetical protein LWC35_31350 [Pseudonocardia kujensis]|uniref:hypothetical protein n=1 Tax=Pseudonocardia kujensis TaxID=1128675 RepID=UPI001E565A2A|nr:hypothetical protein [Pseudonocardia kujensis]MCE0767368.1 hypothetical protein [Pseudonocardia kujensis]
MAQVPVVSTSPAPSTLTRSAQEEVAGEIAGHVLGARPSGSRSGGITLSYRDGRRAVLEEATLGTDEDLRPEHLRHRCAMQWPAPARWWWHVTVHDVSVLPRVRELFPMAARTCEAVGVRGPGDLPAPLTWAVPDLHWLLHARPAQLRGHPLELGRPATVVVAPGREPAVGMAAVGPALPVWLGRDTSVRALRRLGARRADERHLYLTLGCGAPVSRALDALARAAGVPTTAPPAGPGVSHLWLAPLIGHSVYLWTRREGWSRHGPYS